MIITKIYEGFVGSEAVKHRWTRSSDGTEIDMVTVCDAVATAFSDIYTVYPRMKDYLVSIDPIYTPDVKTLATDGCNIFINPQFVYDVLLKKYGFNVIALEFALLHEASHILFQHCYDIESISAGDHELVNAAQDYEINYLIANFIRDNDPTSDNPTPFMDVVKDGFLYDDKLFANWKKIYNDPRFRTLIEAKSRKKSPEWIKGFMDGCEKYKEKLREEGKIR